MAKEYKYVNGKYQWVDVPTTPQAGYAQTVATTPVGVATPTWQDYSNSAYQSVPAGNTPINVPMVQDPLKQTLVESGVTNTGTSLPTTTTSTGTPFFDTSKGYAGAVSQGLGLVSEGANLYSNLEGLGVFGGTSNADLRKRQEQAMKQNINAAKYNLDQV